jgi:alpha-glucosidase (family GH31 glycosyl hydrolase)
MKATTAGIFSSNVFGYSLVGGDICGFMGSVE